MLTADRRNRNDCNTLLEKQILRTIMTPEGEYITRTTGYASYTRRVYDAIICDVKSISSSSKLRYL